MFIINIQKIIINLNHFSNSLFLCLKQKTQQQKQQRAESVKAAVARYREKLKEDPDRHEIYLQKKRDYYHAHKNAENLSASQLSRIRTYKTQKKREWRARKKTELENVPLANMSSDSELDDNFPAPVAKIPKKKVTKRVRKCYKALKKKNKENAQLKKTITKLNRKIKNLKKSKTDASLLPADPILDQVDELLSDTVVNADVIRKKLIAGEAVIQQVKEKYQSSGHKEKRNIAEALSGSITKNHRLQTDLRKRIAPILKNSNLQESGATRKERETSLALQQEVENFIIENCTVDPGKKHCKRIGENLVPRHYLNANLIDLHKKFCIEKSKKIALSTFCKYRPVFCVVPKFSERDTCACPKHTNFQFLIDALYEAKIILEKSTHQFVKSLTCDKIKTDCFRRLCNDCKKKSVFYNINPDNRNQEIKYKQWINVNNEERISAKTGKVIKVSYVKTADFSDRISNVVNIIKAQTDTFLSHEMGIFHHYHENKKLKDKLENGDEEIIMLTMDFSENWDCKYFKEIQANHFGASKQPVSLHTCHVYNSEIQQGCVTASDNVSHDASAIIAHLIKTFQIYEKDMFKVKHVHFISDSVLSQYRNKSMFFLMTQIFSKLFPKIQTISHHYSESNHGKSIADGDGAVVKRTGDSIVTYGKDLPNFKTFLEVVSEKLKGVLLAEVTKQEIEGIENQLKENELKTKTFVGTTKVRQYNWNRNNPSIVNFNTLSCVDCPPGEKCKHFYLGSLNYDEPIVGTIPKRKRSDIKIISNQIVEKKDKVTKKVLFKENEVQKKGPSKSKTDVSKLLIHQTMKGSRKSPIAKKPVRYTSESDGESE